jgi:hypothetical protein
MGDRRDRHEVGARVVVTQVSPVASRSGHGIAVAPPPRGRSTGEEERQAGDPLGRGGSNEDDSSEARGADVRCTRPSSRKPPRSTRTPGSTTWPIRRNW